MFHKRGGLIGKMYKKMAREEWEKDEEEREDVFHMAIELIFRKEYQGRV